MNTLSKSTASSNKINPAHETYEKLMGGLFKGVGKVSARQSQPLAMLLYGAYASIHFGWMGFENAGHDAVSPWEADACKAVADMLLKYNGKKPMTHNEIGDMFRG